MRAFSCAWSLPATWQRWRWHHLIHHSRKPHATRKLHGSVFYRTGVVADRSGIRIFDLFCFCYFDLDPVTFVYELTCTPHRYTVCVKMNFVRQGFRKLSYCSLRMRAFIVTCGHFRSRDNDDRGEVARASPRRDDEGTTSQQRLHKLMPLLH